MSKQKSHYLPALDGMRALSILVVLIGHLGYKWAPAGFGVNVFFFVSGLLITNLLLIEYKKSASINFKNFFIRRLLRLYPPLLLLILVTAALPALNYGLTADKIWPALFYYQNYYYIANFDAFNTGESHSFFGFIWSLAIEEHFYMVFPFLFALCARSKKWLIGITVGTIAMALLFRLIATWQYGVNEYASYYTYAATHCRLDSIMTGCLASILVFYDTDNKFIRFVSSIPVFSFAALAVVLSLIPANGYFKQTFVYTVQGLAFLALIPAILYNSKYEWLNKLLSIKPLVFIGRLSYSLYLFHLVFYRLELRYISHTKDIWYIILGIPGAILLAMCSYYLVEMPVMSLRRRFGSAAGKGKDEQPHTVIPEHAAEVNTTS